MSKLSTTTKRFPPVHPGKLLKQDLEDGGISMNELALAIRVPSNRIVAIVQGQRRITAETALRLGLYFHTSADYWLQLQTRFDLETVKDRLGERLKQEVSPRSSVA